MALKKYSSAVSHHIKREVLKLWPIENSLEYAEFEKKFNISFIVLFSF